jgi:hypothetical protein
MYAPSATRQEVVYSLVRLLISSHLDILQVDAPKCWLQCHQQVHQLNRVITRNLEVKRINVCTQHNPRTNTHWQSGNI